MNKVLLIVMIVYIVLFIVDTVTNIKRTKAYNEMEKTNLEFNDLLMRQNRFLIEQSELLRKYMSKTGARRTTLDGALSELLRKYMSKTGEVDDE